MPENQEDKFGRPIYCPKCKKKTIREEVDIGVGYQHRPAYCGACNWDQQNEIDKTMEEAGLIKRED